MKRKGFTLVELLAVLVILGMLSLIVVPNVISVMKNQKNNLYNTQINLIIDAAEGYVAENVFSITDEELANGYSIYLKDLYQKGYLQNKIQNPNTGENFGQCLKIVVAKVATETENYSYTVVEETISNENGC